MQKRKYVVKYVRNIKREPVVAVVGLSDGKIGVAIAPTNKPVNKRLLTEIAFGRAESSHLNVVDGVAYPPKIPNRLITLEDNHTYSMFEAIKVGIKNVQHKIQNFKSPAV